MSEPSTPGHSWLARIGWLLLLWVAGVATLTAIALVLRGLMSVGGLRV
jgi:hypothetical protein